MVTQCGTVCYCDHVLVSGTPKGTYDIKTFVIQKYTMWNCLRNTYDIQKGTYYIKTFV